MPRTAISTLKPPPPVHSLPNPPSMASDPKPSGAGNLAPRPPSLPPPPAYGAPTAYPGYYGEPYPAYYSAPASPPPRHPSATLLRRFLTIVVAAIVGTGVAIFITWLVLRPRLPIFSVSSASLSSFNLSSSQLSSDLSVSLSVRNPNHKMTIHYYDFRAQALYDFYTISDVALPPMDQRKGNVTEIQARLVAMGEFVGADVAQRIDRERRTMGTVGFQVRVLSLVRYSSGVWWTRTNVLRVFCDDVRIKFANATENAGLLDGTAKPCLVRLIKSIVFAECWLTVALYQK
ncbi:hypothetical protein DsansV1_C08g0086161 [Dioscorea sansibarensis]